MLDVLKVALAEEGYLEKRNGQQLDSKTKNAGSNNYTKYARDLFPSLQGQPWCDMFVDWCMVQAYGKERAKKLLCGGFAAYTVTSAGYYKKAGRYGKKPKVGSPVFFRNSERICHTGLVYKVDASRFYTIEGNTSGASGVIANGGGVCKKSYPLGYGRVDGFGYPDYEGVLGKASASDISAASAQSHTLRKGSRGEAVKELQRRLNAAGATLAVDGVFGPATQAAVFWFQRAHGLEDDGICGPMTWKALRA